MRFPPFQAVHADGDPSLLIVCDHAANATPPETGDLGLAPADMGRHIAHDVGARGVTLALAEALDAPAVLATFSRLVVDPNRGEDDPTLIMRLSDGSIVPGNRRVDGAERRRRIEAYHRPYHAAISATIDRALARRITPRLIAVHSFTPQLRGRTPRPWHVGVLWDRDVRVAHPLIARLEAEGDLCVGDNEPYSGQLRGDTMWRHGAGRGLPHALVEIRNDLIQAHDDQAAWGARLARCLRDALRAG